MGIFTHFQRRIRSPATAAESAGSLLTLRSVIATWTLTLSVGKRNFLIIKVIAKEIAKFVKINVRDITAFDASSAIVAWIIQAAFIASEITGTTSALWLDIDPHAYEGRFVGTDQVRQSADFHNICARSFAGLILLQALVDDHFSFDLTERGETERPISKKVFFFSNKKDDDTNLFSMLEDKCR
jgi:hypothetical protein